jgi:hypothetical protein
MLTEILNAYRKSGGAVSLDALSRRLGIEKSALEGMLETLMRQGKLREVANPPDACGSCSSGGCHGCASYKTASKTGKTYELVD